MNTSLLKNGIKANWKMLVIFGAVITMYVSIMVYMYNPDMNSIMEQFAKTMPQLMAFVGMNAGATDLTGFLASYLYGFILLIFPMIFIIITANSLLVRHVDRGSMSFLLASPNKRTRIAFTQAVTLIIGIFILVAYATFLAIGVSHALFPNELDIKGYLILNLGLFCLHFFIGGLCFFSSCVFNDVKSATLFGGGITILCYLFQSIANVGEKLENLKYATFFTLFDSNLLINGDKDGYIMIACLFTSGLILFIIGITTFNKRDLHV